MPAITNSVLDREARRSALLAKRSTRPSTVEVTVKATDVQPGDFVVRVDTQLGIRGATYDTIVADVTPVADAYRWRGRRGARVDGVAFKCANPILVALIWPNDFDVVVRRAVTS